MAWPTDPISFPVTQGVICLLIPILLLISWKFNLHNTVKAAVSVDIDGNWLWLNDDRNTEFHSHWAISNKSRMTSWLLFIHLKPQLDNRSKGKWIWLSCFELTQRDYRRLCQIILKIK